MDTIEKQLVRLVTRTVLDNNPDDTERIIETFNEVMSEHPENRDLNKLLKEALGEYELERLQRKLHRPERTQANRDHKRRYRD